MQQARQWRAASGQQQPAQPRRQRRAAAQHGGRAAQHGWQHWRSRAATPAARPAVFRLSRPERLAAASLQLWQRLEQRARRWRARDQPDRRQQAAGTGRQTGRTTAARAAAGGQVPAGTTGRPGPTASRNSRNPFGFMRLMPAVRGADAASNSGAQTFELQFSRRLLLKSRASSLPASWRAIWGCPPPPAASCASR